MKGNCETCRHWKDKPLLPENWAICQLTDTVMWKPTFPRTLAWVEMRTGEWAALRTHATHGCMQWEGKA